MFLNLDKINKNKIAAWAVHGFTGSGAVLGFLAIISILNSDATGAFLWLGLALLIDGLDGTLARKVNVTEQTPNIDGTILDSVIDYLNYVIIPSLMIYWFSMVPDILEIILPAAIFLVSLYTFSNLQMKTKDYYFSGFPAVWNIVVLYFFILGTHEYINVAVIVICLILTFVPIKFVHPFSTVRRYALMRPATDMPSSGARFPLITLSIKVCCGSHRRTVEFWSVCNHKNKLFLSC